MVPRSEQPWAIVPQSELVEALAEIQRLKHQLAEAQQQLAEAQQQVAEAQQLAETQQLAEAQQQQPRAQQPAAEAKPNQASTSDDYVRQVEAWAYEYQLREPMLLQANVTALQVIGLAYWQHNLEQQGVRHTKTPVWERG